jgi:hypothetical protein
MSGTIEIPFNIGETVYWIGNGYAEEMIQCPECLGTKTIKMVQANGKEFQIDCAGCSVGFERSTGQVKRGVWNHRPTLFTPRRVEISGAEVRYSEADPTANCYSCVNAKELFRLEAECLVACDKANEEKAEALRGNEIARLKSKKRDMAWSVHYWQSVISNLERDLENARARLGVCKERERVKSEKAKA